MLARPASYAQVEKLIAAKQRGRDEYPCDISGCDQWQAIDSLLRNAPAARMAREAIRPDEVPAVFVELRAIREDLKTIDRKGMNRYRTLDNAQRRRMSQVDDHFDRLMQVLTDEAKEGPRLFSFEPVEPGFFDRPIGIAQKFRLTLWCEHARVPLPVLNGEGDSRGVYELSLTRDWVKKAAPFLEWLSTALRLVLPVASSATELLMDDAAFDRITKELDFGQKCADALLKGGEKVGGHLAHGDAPDWKGRDADDPIRAQGGVLRELQALLKDKDPTFGGLVRVQNKRREFLWVHERFVDEY